MKQNDLSTKSSDLVVDLQLNEQDMDGVCRVCMSGAGELIDIFVAEAESPSLEEMINECVDVKIKRDDQYPKKMCEICIADVHAAFRFKRNYQLTLEQLSKSSPLNISAENTLLEPIVTENIVLTKANGTITSEQDKRKKRVQKVIIKKKQKLLRVQRMCTSETKKRIRKKHLREPEQKIKTEQPESAEYPCKICGEVFALQQRLQMHMRTHDKQTLSTPHSEQRTSTAAREFKCWRCQKGFSFKCNLKKHLANEVCLKPTKAKSVSQ